MDALTTERARMQQTTATILWAAILTSTFMMGAVVFVVPRPPELTVPILLPVLAGLSLVLLVVSVLLPAKVMNDAFRRATWETRDDVANPREASKFAKHERVFEDPAATLERAQTLAMQPMILRLALREAIACFGLVLAMLGAPLPLSLAFHAVSALAIAVAMPRQSAIVAALEQATGTRFPTSLPS